MAGRAGLRPSCLLAAPFLTLGHLLTRISLPIHGVPKEGNETPLVPSGHHLKPLKPPPHSSIHLQNGLKAFGSWKPVPTLSLPTMIP